MASAYGTIEAANQYFTDRGGAAAFPLWFGATTEDRQLAHVLGTDYVDRQYEARLQGRRADADQERAFPRAGLIIHGESFSDSATPSPAQQASWEAALRHLQGEQLLPDGQDLSAGEIIAETKKGGPASKALQYRPRTATNRKRFPVIDRLMAPLLQGSGGVPVMLIG